MNIHSKDLVKTQGEDAIYKPWKEALGETKSANLELLASRIMEDKFLFFKATHYFIMEAN